MKISIIGGINSLFSGRDWRPPSLPRIPAGVLQSGIYIKLHILKKTIPDNTGNKRHVVRSCRLALE